MASVESIADIGVKLHVLKGKTDIAPIKDAGKELDILAQRQRTASFAAMNFNRIVQDSPYFLTSFNMGLMSVANNIAPFTESLAAAKKEGIGMLSMLKGMFTGIGGWLTVINLAVAGVQMLTMWMANNKRETKNATEEQDAYLTKLKEVAQFRNTGGVSFTRAQVETALYRATKERATLEGAIRLEQTSDIQYLLKMDELYEQTNGKRGRAISLETKNLLLGVKTVSQYEARIKEIDKERAFLSENLETLKEQEKMVGRLISLGGSASGKTSERASDEKKVTEELGNQLELRKKLLIEQVKANQFSIFGGDEAITEQDLKREAARMQAKRRKIGVLGAETALKSPEKPAEQGSEEGLDYGTAFTGAFSSTFTQGMTSAWTKIFGEANSIGEIFIQSFVNSLISQLSGRLATSTLASISGGGSGGGIFGVFGGILGGIGSLFGLNSRGNEGRPVMAGTSTNVVLNIDGKKLMQVAVEPNFNKSIINMQRTKRL